jgi:hypothetical protein
MPTFTTIYRAIVMVAAGVIVVKGWQLYGPTAEQGRAFGMRALEIAKDALSGAEPSAAEEHDGLPPDPRLAAVSNAPPTAPAAMIDPAPPLATPAVVAPAGEPASATLMPMVPNQPEAAEPAPLSGAGTSAGDDLSALLVRLEQMGIVETELSQWGGSGRMYRFHCRAPLGNSAAFVQHFEAVAAEPRVAVEQVVAKVEAWQAARQERTALR